MGPLDLDLKSSTIEKFIDVVASAIGKLSAPYLLRKMAEAKGQEIIQIAQSIETTRKMIGDSFEINVNTESFKISPRSSVHVEDPNLKRIEDRLKTVEQERQKNIDNIALYGLLESRDISDSSAENVDRDWLNQFINVSQDVSSDQMQEVWGKILAREISNPGSFSLRSLEVLRTISKNEAEIFRRISQYAVTVNKQKYVFYDQIDEPISSDIWHDYNSLREVGLFMPIIFRNQFHACPSCNPIFRYGNVVFKVTTKKEDVDIDSKCWPLSSVGNELARLIEIVPVEGYVEKVKDEVSKNKYITIQDLQL